MNVTENDVVTLLSVVKDIRIFQWDAEEQIDIIIIQTNVRTRTPAS